MQSSILQIFVIAILCICCSSEGGAPEVASVGEQHAALCRNESEQLIRICHYAAHDAHPRIMTVPVSALASHVKHGDALAPVRLRNGSDCTAPHLPAAAVTATAVTDRSGAAILLVPDTNIRIRALARDSLGTAVQGTTVQLVASGSSYVIVARGASGSTRFAPTFVEGNLLDARPGSAPTIIVNIVMSLVSSTFPGGAFFDSTTSSFQFIANQFSSTTECFTRAEFKSFVETFCATASTTSGLIFSGLTLGTSGSLSLVGGAIIDIGGLGCGAAAQGIADSLFASSTKPLMIRGFGLSLPLIPGTNTLIAPIPTFPIAFQVVGPCGGACCDSSAADPCTVVSRETMCSAGPAAYIDGADCNPSICPTEYTLSVSRGGPAAAAGQVFSILDPRIDCGPPTASSPRTSCVATVADGDVVLLGAAVQAGSGAEFVSWGGDCIGAANSMPLVITGDTTCFAVFDCPQSTSWDAGTASCAPCAGTSSGAAATGIAEGSVQFSTSEGVFYQGQFFAFSEYIEAGPIAGPDAADAEPICRCEVRDSLSVVWAQTIAPSSSFATGALPLGEYTMSCMCGSRSSINHEWGIYCSEGGDGRIVNITCGSVPHEHFMITGNCND
jgi:hypothetical protein